MQGNAPDEEYEDPHGECAHEIAKLRAALRSINDYTPGPVSNPNSFGLAFNNVRAIARIALGNNL